MIATANCKHFSDVWHFYFETFRSHKYWHDICLYICIYLYLLNSVWCWRASIQIHSNWGRERRINCLLFVFSFLYVMFSSVFGAQKCAICQNEWMRQIEMKMLHRVNYSHIIYTAYSNTPTKRIKNIKSPVKESP